MTSGVYRMAECAEGDLEHKHGRGCLPKLVKLMPPPPEGWKYGYGATGGGWSIWLERVGGTGARWHLLGLPAASSVGHLAALVEAYTSGYRGGLEKGPLL